MSIDVSILKIDKPVWFMRQAGRHLPEYRKLRLRKDNFLDFCFDFNSIVESTLQPIKRYDIDCAIVFSDILVIPFLLGQRVSFHKGLGPNLESMNLKSLLELESCNRRIKKLEISYAAIKRIRLLLNSKKSLIGFCGAPWTVSCYMIDGNSRNGFSLSMDIIKNKKFDLELLLDKLVNASISHLVKQYESGCDTLMIFESWAGLVNHTNRKDILYSPVKKIISGLRERNVNAPIIVFPKGLGKGIIDYINNVTADVIGIDYETDMDWVIINIEKDIILQGNLNPEVLLRGGNKLVQDTLKIKRQVEGRQHIFNLGHGLLPGTPIRNVHKCIEILRN